jgi:hypothetical protein
MPQPQPLSADDLCLLMPSVFKVGTTQSVGWRGVASFIKPVTPTQSPVLKRRERISPSH